MNAAEMLQKVKQRFEQNLLDCMEVNDESDLKIEVFFAYLPFLRTKNNIK